MLGLGGELAKEVDFIFMFCYYFVQAHFVMFSGLLDSLFYKVVILNNLFFCVPACFLYSIMCRGGDPSWQQLQQLHTHHHHSSEVVRFLFDLCIVSALSTAY